MSTVSGQDETTLSGFSVLPAGPPHTYLGVANGLLPGVQLLAEAQAPPAKAISLLAAHTVECLLKAFLSRNGSDADLRSEKIRHNLNELWTCASADGLQISAEPPYWVQRLSELHNWPYYLRYSTGVHGIVMPPMHSIVSGLVELHDTVSKSIEHRDT